MFTLILPPKIISFLKKVVVLTLSNLLLAQTALSTTLQLPYTNTNLIHEPDLYVCVCMCLF